jgi:hypothetical protein
MSAKSNGAESNAAVDKLIAEANLIENAKKTVPAQGEKNNTSDGSQKPELTVIEGEKKSFKERLTSVTEKLKENKKTVMAVGAAVGIVALTFAKYAKKQAEEALVEVIDEPAGDDTTEKTSDENAA